MIAFAESDEGQHYYAIFTDLGITPAEWRAMDSRDTLFLVVSKSEQNKRVNNQNKQNNTRQRLGR